MKTIVPVILILVAMISLAFIPELVLGQPGLPGNPSQAPIDGGLGLLAAGGAAYAIKKIRENKSKE